MRPLTSKPRELGDVTLRAYRRRVMTLYDCPECGLPATVQSHGYASSTHGAVEHVQVRCAAGDWFLGPAETLRIRLPAPDSLS